ncbi:MAG: hypothetical protein R3F17_03120 [Planctomycetota bacterium]
MIRRFAPAPFLVLEGPDGVGKTTLRKALFHRFALQGAQPLVFNGNAWTDLASTEVLTRARFLGKVYPEPELIRAFVRDREELGHRFIAPNRGKVPILCDRYLLSDLIYGAMTLGLSAAKLAAAYVQAALPEPDAVLILQAPFECAAERLIARGRAAHVWEEPNLQKRIHAGYHSLGETARLGWGCPIIRLDNIGSPSELTEAAWRAIHSAGVQLPPSQTASGQNATHPDSSSEHPLKSED